MPTTGRARHWAEGLTAVLRNERILTFSLLVPTRGLPIVRGVFLRISQTGTSSYVWLLLSYLFCGPFFQEARRRKIHVVE